MRTITITSTNPIKALDEQGDEVTGIWKLLSTRRDPDPISVSIDANGKPVVEWPPLIHEIEFADGTIEQVHLVRA
jgi:hypothetical protein